MFGAPATLEPFPAPDLNTLIGPVWHHAPHAWICLQRRVLDGRGDVDLSSAPQGGSTIHRSSESTAAGAVPAG
jgi:hypothetical protein